MSTSLPRPLLLFRRVCWLGVFIWAATVFTLSHLSGARVDDLNVFRLWDKAAHFIAFFAGALPLVPALRLSGFAPWKRLIVVAIIALSAYGALDEVHQYFTPSRSALDPGDWFADTLGACAGVLLTACIHARFEKTHRPTPSRN